MFLNVFLKPVRDTSHLVSQGLPWDLADTFLDVQPEVPGHCSCPLWLTHIVSSIAFQLSFPVYLMCLLQGGHWETLVISLPITIIVSEKECALQYFSSSLVCKQCIIYT